ncbi:hypothetical protein L596_017118 [Steinernema carpocapsae]|uniref:Uncharacterized protein n=1 Tax=Steinernema carpocapsae TaxID=34508 RepID=A0A4U5N0N1_STECR|nr:hypothetical protein L596_017118 [Steinernema carpocapsae]
MKSPRYAAVVLACSSPFFICIKNKCVMYWKHVISESEDPKAAKSKRRATYSYACFDFRDVNRDFEWGKNV